MVHVSLPRPHVERRKILYTPGEFTHTLILYVPQDKKNKHLPSKIVIWQFEDRLQRYRWLEWYCSTQSAEPLQGLKNTAVEQPRLPAALMSDQDASIRPRSVDQDDLSLKQAELGVRLG